MIIVATETPDTGAAAEQGERIEPGQLTIIGHSAFHPPA
jgi:hypothetical protein